VNNHALPKVGFDTAAVIYFSDHPEKKMNAAFLTYKAQQLSFY